MRHTRSIHNNNNNNNISRQTPRRLVDLSFIPNSLSALVLPNTTDTLLAVGGQEAELHLAYYRGSSTSSSSSSDTPTRTVASFGHKEWESKDDVEHGSINNSVLLTSLSLTRSNESSVEPRLIVSNNDRSVKFYDVSLREGDDSSSGNTNPSSESNTRLVNVGQLRLDVPINHCELFPYPTNTILLLASLSSVIVHHCMCVCADCCPFFSFSLPFLFFLTRKKRRYPRTAARCYPSETLPTSTCTAYQVGPRYRSRRRLCSRSRHTSATRSCPRSPLRSPRRSRRRSRGTAPSSRWRRRRAWWWCGM